MDAASWKWASIVVPHCYSSGCRLRLKTTTTPTTARRAGTPHFMHENDQEQKDENQGQESVSNRDKLSRRRIVVPNATRLKHDPVQGKLGQQRPAEAGSVRIDTSPGRSRRSVPAVMSRTLPWPSGRCQARVSAREGADVVSCMEGSWKYCTSWQARRAADPQQYLAC